MHRIIAAMLTLALALPAWAEPVCGSERRIAQETMQQLQTVNDLLLRRIEPLFAALKNAEPLSPAREYIMRAIEAAYDEAERAESLIIEREIARELAECRYVSKKPVR